MNKEYFNIKNNLYGVTNEEGNITVINSNTDPEEYLTKKNEIEHLMNLQESNYKTLKYIKSIFKTKTISLIALPLVCSIVFLRPSDLTLINEIILYLGVTSLGGAVICITSGMTYKKMKEYTKFLKEKSIEVPHEIDLLKEEVKTLEKNIEYKEVVTKDYSNIKNDSNVHVKKLVLKNNIWIN